MSEFLFALAVVAAAPFALVAGGCGGGGGRSATPAASEGVRGTVTFENRSSLDICWLAVTYQGGRIAEEVSFGAGATVEVNLEGDTSRLFLTECGGQRSLYSHPMN